MADSGKPPPPGRPRDSSLDEKTIEAAWELLGQKPLSKISIQEIADRAGTTRPAIYRRWESINGIVVDAFLQSVSDRVTLPDLPDPRDQFRVYLGKIAAFLSSRQGKAIIELLAPMRHNELLLQKMLREFLRPRRANGFTIIERGQALGIFRTDIPRDTIIDLYSGPIYYRVFSQHAEIDEEFTQGIADMVLRAISVD